ncbi:uncharacterized protein LOC114006575 [Tupaia chinensis]|uniref:uncharacterized protein LOC114006575 n=1 Tax=Tupaia chinensis TaxID=246437 RepID=UPI000FFB7F4D|nr:uncharacterized protein LOC114006575 [Tupaia chinensis]
MGPSVRRGLSGQQVGHPCIENPTSEMLRHLELSEHRHSHKRELLLRTSGHVCKMGKLRPSKWVRTKIRRTRKACCASLLNIRCSSLPHCLWRTQPVTRAYPAKDVGEVSGLQTPDEARRSPQGTVRQRASKVEGPTDCSRSRGYHPLRTRFSVPAQRVCDAKTPTFCPTSESLAAPWKNEGWGMEDAGCPALGQGVTAPTLSYGEQASSMFRTQAKPSEMLSLLTGLWDAFSRAEGPVTAMLPGPSTSDVQTAKQSRDETEDSTLVNHAVRN